MVPAVWVVIEGNADGPALIRLNRRLREIFRVGSRAAGNPAHWAEPGFKCLPVRIPERRLNLDAGDIRAALVHKSAFDVHGVPNRRGGHLQVRELDLVTRGLGRNLRPSGRQTFVRGARQPPDQRRQNSRGRNDSHQGPGKWFLAWNLQTRYFVQPGALRNIRICRHLALTSFWLGWPLNCDEFAAGRWRRGAADRHSWVNEVQRCRRLLLA